MRGESTTEDPEQSGDRDGDEERLLEAVRAQIVHRQGQEGERYQSLEGSALVGAFLDPVDLEDEEQQTQKRKIAQKRPQAAAAVLGLAGIETPLRRLATARSAAAE